jgi:hypothetical protein
MPSIQSQMTVARFTHSVNHVGPSYIVAIEGRQPYRVIDRKRENENTMLSMMSPCHTHDPQDDKHTRSNPLVNE